ncbi:hypothetical protein NDU88_006122 [Pleurodeles waltl]|uniref:Uncharacterized protein n=1 Tax=Pleurodeles waltl TaxID=8319 RepID=A0AAV7RLK7_PLEWA|nr:hypothetical protein NDU88_006122 [Pleurodeles waltl]
MHGLAAGKVRAAVQGSLGALAGRGGRRWVVTSVWRAGVRQCPGECSQDLGVPSRTGEGDKKTLREATAAARFFAIGGWAGDCARSETQHFLTVGFDRSALQRSGAVACTTAQSSLKT